MCQLFSLDYKIERKEKELKPFGFQLLRFCRDYWTRTSDLAPPRRVRYQLR